LALCLFLVCGTRASSAIEKFKVSYQKARDEIGAPLRCAGRGEVTLSPTIRTREPEGGKPEEHITLWSARTTNLDCEGRTIQGPLILRLSGGPEDLARADQVEFIAQLAPVRLFRNANLSDPWPGATRREAV